MTLKAFIHDINSKVKKSLNLSNKMCEDAVKHGRPEVVIQNGHIPRTMYDHRYPVKKSLQRTMSAASRTGERKGHRIFLTICVYVTFFELGLVGSVMGPTIVHMQHLLGTDIKGMTLTFVCQRIGYVLGVVLSGLLFDRLNQELQFAAACLIEGVVVVFAPLAPHIYGYYALMGTQSLAHGYINTGLQSFLLSLWEGRKYKEPIMQGCPAVWSIGAAICPFIIRPFLVNIPEEAGQENATLNGEQTTDLYPLNITHDSKLYHKIERVKYPYMIVGVNFAALCLLYIIAYMMLGPECDRKVLRTKKRHRHRTGDVRGFRIPLLVMLFFFFMFHAWYEGIFSGLLTAFVVEGLDWPVASGPLITFVFYASHAVGRLLGIPISVLVSSAKMVFSDVIMTSIAFTIMLFVPRAGEIFMWFATALAGFAMATTYASTVLWSSQYITITGAAGSVFLLGSSTGGMSGGALIGWLFQTHTYMWVVYMALAACVTHIALFSAMYVFARCHQNKLASLKHSLPHLNHATPIMHTLQASSRVTTV